MAVALVQDCPHCGAENTGFALHGFAMDPLGSRGWNMLFVCNVCGGPVAARGADGRSGRSPGDAAGDVKAEFPVFDTWPKPRPHVVPAHLPDAVAKAFLQAEESVGSAKKTESTAAMDRRALELATKLIAPEHAALSLFHRIERLAADHLITPALRDWAHSLRTIGNESLHDIEGVTHDEARQTHEVTRFVLTYLFTLPKQVELSRSD